MTCTCRQTASGTGVITLQTFPCPEHGWEHYEADVSVPAGTQTAEAYITTEVYDANGFRTHHSTHPDTPEPASGLSVSFHGRCPSCGHVGNMEAP